MFSSSSGGVGLELIAKAALRAADAPLGGGRNPPVLTGGAGAPRTAPGGGRGAQPRGGGSGGGGSGGPCPARPWGRGAERRSCGSHRGSGGRCRGCSGGGGRAGVRARAARRAVPRHAPCFTRPPAAAPAGRSARCGRQPRGGARHRVALRPRRQVREGRHRHRTRHPRRPAARRAHPPSDSRGARGSGAGRGAAAPRVGGGRRRPWGRVAGGAALALGDPSGRPPGRQPELCPTTPPRSGPPGSVRGARAVRGVPGRGREREGRPGWGGARGCGLRSIRGGRSVHWRSTRRSAEAGGTGALRGGVTRAPKSPERRAGGDAEGPRLHKSGCFSPLLFIFLFLLFVQRVAQPPGDSRVVPPCGECHASRCSPCTTHAAGTADMGCPGTSPGHRRRGLRASLGGTAGSGGWFSYSYF